MKKEQIKERIIHLKNLKKFYKQNKTIHEWNIKFKEEFTNLNIILKGMV